MRIREDETLANPAASTARRAGAAHAAPLTSVDAMLALQMSAGNAAVAATLSSYSTVQRSESSGENTESNAPTEEGGIGGGAEEVACGLLPDSVVVRSIRIYFAARYHRASDHLVYYLEGHGGEYEEDVGSLIRSNPRGAKRVGKLIGAQGAQTGSVEGRTADTAVIRQVDYDDEDWKLSLGGIDQFNYEVLGEAGPDGLTDVTLHLLDPYQWHPAEEQRGDQCIHAAMAAQTAQNPPAKDYVSTGSETVRLQLEQNDGPARDAPAPL